MCWCAGAGTLTQQRDRQNGSQQHDTEQCEAVSISHDRCLRADYIADGDDGLVPCFPHARDPLPNEVLLQVAAEKLGIDGARRAVCEEVLLQVRAPFAGGRLEQRHMAVDDERVKLLAKTLVLLGLRCLTKARASASCYR